MRLILVVILIATVATAKADIVHLRDGSCHQGRIIAEAGDIVRFRIVLPGGGAVVRDFSRSDIRRIQRKPMDSEQSVDDQSPETPDDPANNYSQMVREAFELLDDGDHASALRALQRAIIRSPEASHPELDALCQKSRGVSLPELIAQTRIRVADAQGGHAFRIRFATPLERPALGRLLKAEQEDRLDNRYSGRSIAEWADSPREYTDLQPEARQLVADASRTAAIVSARLRFDPELEDAPKQRVQLLHLRRDLSRLAAHVLALPGYTEATEDDGVEDPAERVARRMAAGLPINDEEQAGKEDAGQPDSADNPERTEVR